MRVLKAGFCTFSQLKDGSLDMSDIWAMNDWLDLCDWMERRARNEADG